jgi:hypothetical protein
LNARQRRRAARTVLAAVSRVSLKPGDVLVIHTVKPLKPEEFQRTNAVMRLHFPDVRVLYAPADFHFSVIERTE